jgi:CelD/BcsL family acetyltransferase involved in cellulose biosynthesis
MIEVEIVDDLPKLQSLRTSWNSLLRRSWNQSIFLTWEWIETWWHCYSAGFDLAVIVVRQGDQVLGIAPLVVRKASRRLEFVGQNKAYGEYLDFLVPQDLEDSIVPAICQTIVRLGELGKWRGIHFATMLEESPNLKLISMELTKAGIELQRSPARVSPHAQLPATWEDYLALKGSSFSRRVRYNERRLARFGEVAIESPRDGREIDEFFDDLVKLHVRRWRVDIDEQFFGFHRKIARIFYELNWLLLARLRVGSTVVALKYDFIFDNKIWGYQGGWLPEFKDREVGNVLIAEILKQAIQDRRREYDFLEGEAWYKSRWSTSYHRAFDLVFGPQDGAYIFEEPSENIE